LRRSRTYIPFIAAQEVDPVKAPKEGLQGFQASSATPALWRRTFESIPEL